MADAAVQACDLTDDHPADERPAEDRPAAADHHPGYRPTRDHPAKDRTSGGRWQRALGPFGILVAVVVANIPVLAGLVTIDPIATTDVTELQYHHGYLPGIPYLDPSIGWIFEPLAHLSALDWLHGIVPWWNPFEGLGAPLAAGMQSAAMFPPIMLLLLPDGLVWFHMCLELIAGMSTWLLLRELGVGKLAATIGGVLFALNGTFAWFAHAPIDPVPWLPLMLLGVERVLHRPGFDVAGWLALALGLALSIYAGFPETAYLEGLFVVCWFVFRLVRAPRSEGIPFVAKAASASIVGMLLSAPLLVAFVENLPIADIGRHAGGIGVQTFVPTGVQMFGLPYIYGPIAAFNSPNVPGLKYFWGSASGGYLTAAVIALAVIGVLARGPHPGLRRMIAVFGLAAAAWQAALPPFASVFQRIIPGTHDVNAFRYFSPAWELAAIVLAACGLDAVARGEPRVRYEGLAAGAVGLGVISFEVGWAWSLMHRLARTFAHYSPYAVASIAWAVATVLVIAAMALLAPRARRVAAAVVAVLLCAEAVAMFGLPQFSAPRRVVVDSAATRFLSAHLGDERYFSMWVYHAEVGSYFQLSSINSNSMPVPDKWASYVRDRLSSDADPLIFDGSRFDGPGPNPVTELHHNFANYEAAGVKFVVVARDLAVFGDPHHGVYAEGTRRVYLDSQFAIYQLPHPRPIFSTSSGDGGCTLSPSGIAGVTARCAHPATIVRSQLDLPGWTAEVNGRNVPIRSADGGLQAVTVPAGVSRIDYTYLPPRETWGIALFVLGILAVLAAVFRRRLRRLAAIPRRGMRSRS